MQSRQRVVMTISMPPDIAEECRKLAQVKGETLSQFFREMFALYKQEKLKEEFKALQEYGVKRRKEMVISDSAVEKLIYEGR
jgi:hypothetical protein